MQRQFLALAGAALLYAGPTSAAQRVQLPEGTAQASSGVAAGIDAVVREQMRRRAIPGVQVAVVRDGRVVYEKAYGVADLETGTSVTRDTAFTLNSSTKSFTGVAVMQLVQDGKLALDAPVGRYLPDLPPTWRLVTVAQLLLPLSGLPDVLIQPKVQGTGSLVGDGGEASA